MCSIARSQVHRRIEYTIPLRQIDTAEAVWNSTRCVSGGERQTYFVSIRLYIETARLRCEVRTEIGDPEKVAPNPGGRSPAFEKYGVVAKLCRISQASQRDKVNMLWRIGYFVGIGCDNLREDTSVRVIYSETVGNHTRKQRFMMLAKNPV